MVQGLSTPDPSLSPYTHISIRRGRATQYTPSGEPDGVAQHYTSAFSGVAHWAGL